MPELICWLSIGAVAYNYVGYPLLLLVLSVLAQAKSDFLYLIRRRSRRPFVTAESAPQVAVLIAVYNEEAVIQAKVRNCLEIDYPPDRLEFMFGLDAPTDFTAELLSRVPSERLRIFNFPVRRGKLAVLSDLARKTSAEILVLTDANTVLDRNAIRNLVRHFADPRVGAVSGEEIRVAAPGTDTGAEGLYWRYESALKILESRLNCSLGGNGAALAVRRSLFNPRQHSIVEDFEVPLEIRFQGYRVVYDPEAIAIEEIAPTASAQFGRRVRIAAGNYQTLFAHLGYLDPRRGFLAFSFFSHRVLRWLAPFLLMAGFVCNMSLAARPPFAALFATQSLFYLMAATGYWLKKQAKPLRWCSGPFHFCSMNLALVLGLLRVLRGQQSLAWKPTPRRLGDVALLAQLGGNRQTDFRATVMDQHPR
jgi:cellulose synthase/poly-beta-1,6-N-acetylglucosamine synthase-like glycosyltransferase